MNEKEIRTNAIIQALVGQRNTAMNHIADLESEIVFLNEKLKRYESEPEVTPATNGLSLNGSHK